MKVGILTFHCTDNPGSVLQAYALQQTVKALGMDCNIVNYQRKGWQKERTLPLKRHFHSFWWIFAPLVLPIVKYGYIPYDRFRRDFLEIVPKEKICEHEEMLRIADEYDKFVVGSDQVWNLDNPKVDYTQFLDFVHSSEKKIAYAASFGKTDVEEKHKDTVASLIRDFSHISVREQQGIKIVHELTGLKAELVLDPSLLLDREQWSKISILPKDNNYILFYLRQSSPNALQIARKLSTQTGLPVVMLRSLWQWTSTGKQVFFASPNKWLGYFLNAKYIVTNSFHGIAFSINFNKQFFAISLEREIAVTNSRILSILHCFGLEDRLIKDESSLVNMVEIDYKTVNSQMKKLREESIAYLKNALLASPNEA